MFVQNWYNSLLPSLLLTLHYGSGSTKLFPFCTSCTVRTLRLPMKIASSTDAKLKIYFEKIHNDLIMEKGAKLPERMNKTNHF